LKFPLYIILPRAEEIKKILAQYCKRIEIAGSIRREVPECKDIELVCIPDSYKLEKFFYDSRPRIYFFKNGPSYKQFNFQGYQIDLFIAKPDNWGLIYLIRTGPAEFGKRVLIEWKKITQGGYSEKGYLRRIDGEKVLTPEEETVFELLNWPFLKPKFRY